MAATLGVLTLLSVLVVTVFANAMASFRSGTLDLEKSRTFFVAEAASESAMAQLAVALEDAVLEDHEITGIHPPTMAGFSFDNFTVQKVGGSSTEMITDGPYAGLYSLTQVVEITAEARGLDYTSSAVMVTAKAQAIPIFQFGVFFENDLEIANGPRMDFEGWVHSNGNIYLSSNSQYFADVITTPNNVYHDRKDRHSTNSGTWIDDASAADVQLTFDSRDTPDHNAFRAKSDASFDNRLKTNAYDVDSLRVPLPSGVVPFEVIQPREASDGTSERQAKFAWKADWYIEVNLNNVVDCRANENAADMACTNPGAAASGTLCTSGLTHTRPGGLATPNNVACRTIFSFDTDSWYESRELRYVDVLNIDVNELFNWMNVSNASEIVYITIDSTGAEDRMNDGVFPVVRLVNASVLGDPITWSTNHPLYVQGDYNTNVPWQPSALAADALTYLSNSWDDTQHQAAIVVRPAAANTTVYAAVMSGSSGTPCDHEEVGCGFTSPYGGGLENFPRFLEHWGGRTLTFRGSLVSLFFSAQGSGLWGCCNYYSPPGRDWRFDSRFNAPENMPPGTPVVGNVIHTAFRPIF